ncbi:GNAT family N-acetyltransferase [Rhodobacter sphaeroides]|jgi:GNAT superfamily N-acetyltransferase|uniref:Acetyltransferase n=2 Tax=Cereibacter sphaeroides TaxID=1063 RepID=Q3J327_CERS4|nr:GNAT family N-acetyltransferase [Cereibacter sphaeroides]ABN76420.1 GCN5-related N-acetyltransferase [Cereibacter sphaeroides ATCC 17029]ABA78807.1 putative Acetyltransferase [Cereibacter sphaeroides 2.4.1]ACM00825.1 GCN5-related N-acetyltransferase precursor [Cereibacter sphaeroides KD131]AMJ47143.1 GCN5 family acetyltransferase [Cereibacter sphaeroides]ANS33856.1 GCN5 family acetyltransferase [Cereibacter sphaeroides]
MSEDLVLRPITPEDEAAWRPVWQAYLRFYETELPEEVLASTFARLTSGAPSEPRGLLAWRGGAAVGLVHYLFHRHCWRIENICYLQDLFTLPEARGRGVATALISAVYRAADAEGAPAVYWHTAENNARARAVYDRIARKSPFIRYNRVL